MILYKKTIVVWSDVPGEGDDALLVLKGMSAPIVVYGLDEGEKVVEPGDQDYDDEVAENFSS
jgi:hypothetical protein